MACCCELQNTLDVEVTQEALLDVEIGGSAGALLQAKSVEITENGTSVVAPDDGFDGLKSVEINTNVPKRFECGDGYFLPITSAQKNLTLISRLQNVDISCWDVSSYTDMSGMFQGCSSLQQLDVSNFDTSKVTNMSGMFQGCSSLPQLDVSNFDTSKVTTMYRMFNGCSSLQSLDVSGWDTSSVTNMNFMFDVCRSLRTLIGNKTLQDVENGAVALRGTKVNIQTKGFPLPFSSILALANGLADLTGATAQTLTISKNSYNNMYNDDDTVPTADVIAERQARIAAICAAKNWNFAH